MLSVPLSGGSEPPGQAIVKRKFPKEKERSQRRSLGGRRGTELGGLGPGQAGGFLRPYVWGEDEFGELWQEIAEGGRFAGGDLARGQHRQGADRRLLGRRRQLALPRSLGAALFEERNDLVHGVVESGRDRRPGALRLDQAKAGEVRLGGKKGEHRARGGDRLERPLVNRGDRLRCQLPDVSDHDVEGGEEALLLALEVGVEDAAGDLCLLG